MNNTIASPSYETVWAALQETDRMLKENAELMRKSREDYDSRMEKYDKKFDKMMETLGSWGNNHGKFAEEYFFNSFEEGKQNFFGEHFDDIKKNLKGAETDDEYDILLVNGKSVGIIEVKFKAHTDHIPKIIRKAETLRINFPKYKNHKIYLGLATLVFEKEVEKECEDKGIAIIKQVGDTIVINDKHLKTF